MKTAAWVAIFYGIFVIVGGIMGYVKADSTPSLITGSIFGVLILSSAFGMFKNILVSSYFCILLIFSLDAFFTYRWLFGHHFMPAGVMSLISSVALIVVALLIRKKVH